MNARTIRRAIERKAQKQARKEAARALPAASAALASVSEARLTANRDNAQHSTGPNTAIGKSISAKNAIKHALTGRTVLLPTDDAERYAEHVEAFGAEWKPQGQRETLLTQSLADIAWRIERIASFEMAIYAKGRAQFATAYADESDAIRPALIEHDIYQANERELRNLHLQENRLRRQRDKDTEELRRLQAERRAAERDAVHAAAQAHNAAQQIRASDSHLASFFQRAAMDDQRPSFPPPSTAAPQFSRAQASAAPADQA